MTLSPESLRDVAITMRLPATLPAVTHCFLADGKVRLAQVSDVPLSQLGIGHPPGGQIQRWSSCVDESSSDY